MAHISVVGAGAFGSALAMNAIKNGHSAKLWAFEKELPEIISEESENTLYLPGFKLPKELSCTNDPQEAVNNADLVLFVTPSAYLRKTVQTVAPFIKENQLILCATKGIEHGTNALMSTVLKDELKQHYHNTAFMSGPSFAKDVAMGLPTDLSCASDEIETARKVQNLLHTTTFRIYTNNDVTGLELGGSLKNVIAISCGASDQLGLGLSARAALMTRGLSEMSRLGRAMGANPLTFQGLSGVGDLILTCTGDLSRNRTLGKEIAKGRTAKEIIGSQRAVAEGYVTAKPAIDLANEYSVDMPLSRAVFEVCYNDMKLDNAIKQLMSRPQKDEFLGLTGV
jgi:glycerol-3-phosphate dehydrogenase (NAD(P)+)